jgi:phosphatidylserine/phosphatidylglycerophosphate/cardiolipin synthase-like enzyme
LLDELLQAADRGVRIRLLLDNFASDARDHRVLLSAAHPKIAMNVFNPPRRGRKRASTRTFGRLIKLSPSPVSLFDKSRLGNYARGCLIPQFLRHSQRLLVNLPGKFTVTFSGL